ncbi:molecular chaperone DnaK [Gammaproteobacteria bacterium 42_54_T18]|nr:molecular chaperone DnaK [Gammaproteobacteria bacterium 42_54_T18]
MSNTLSSRFLIGIDLGTTHTVVAYADISRGPNHASPTLFEIDQLVSGGEVAKRKLLPSFRYHPTLGEIADEDIALPWGKTTLRGDVDSVVVGEWARELGSKVEGRQVASAKSWLSHDQVDRTADILPWGGTDDVEKVSPVLASASYLAHVRAAWNYANPDDLIEHQKVTITVPASFDEAARSLTITAAKYAGLPNVVLIEEPQAVVYDWYYRHKTDADGSVEKVLENTKLLLVCDVGGGTTDLSLIQVKEKNQKLVLSRIGVGDHLMLGGDNVDLALAHQAEQQIAGVGKQLRLSTLAQLIQQSRQAKELLMSESSPASANVTVLGSGSRLIGGAKTAQLHRDSVQELVLNGFFPKVNVDDLPATTQSGVVAFGLPYAKDPAIPKHIAQFLQRYQRLSQKALGVSSDEQAVPDTVLFNGGVFNSPLIKRQLLDVLTKWKGEPLVELDNGSPDLAVAYGAVGYAISTLTGKFTIGGGAAHSFFLCVDGDAEGICLLPRGTEKGEEVLLAAKRFSLRLGEPVRFDLYSVSNDDRYFPGQIVDCSNSIFKKLPPLMASLDCSMDGATEVDVVIVCYLTEIGTVKMQCASIANPLERWDLEFEIKDGKLSEVMIDKPALTTPTKNLPPNFKKARELIACVYGSSDKSASPDLVKKLRKELELTLGKKEKWPLHLLRAMFVELISGEKKKRRSKDHERVWFNLAGYTLRPGVGFESDYSFVQAITPLYEAGLQFGQSHQAWAEWWSFWRRIAPGLPVSIQIRLFEDVAKFIDPATARNASVATESKKKAYEEMLRLSASLEHLPLLQKRLLGKWLVSRLEKDSSSASLWWALGRVGSRVLVGAGSVYVVPADEAEQWLMLALAEDWKKQSPAGLCAMMIARRSGDRMVDVSTDMRKSVVEKLINEKCPESWVEMVRSVSELDSIDTKRMYGDALPMGLTLLA